MHRFNHPTTSKWGRPAGEGFTLIEMLIVISVMLILGAMVAPMMTQTAATRLASAAQLLAADLSYAQVESISHGDDPRVVVFDTANATYRIAASSDTATPITNPIGNQPYEVTFGSGRAREMGGVTLQSVSVGGDDTLGFGIYGELDQTVAASVTLESDGFTLVVTVDPVTGEANIGSVN